jgi:hypothetical protein
MAKVAKFDTIISSKPRVNICTLMWKVKIKVEI